MHHIVGRSNMPDDGSLLTSEVNPTNPATAYATFSGFSGFATGDTLGHVFQTMNTGGTWTDISGNLSNIPVNDLVVDPVLANTFYAATDTGVFMTSNGGTTWSTYGTLK
jgi:photosystem II stability/assembly factor-like uncharacterized protein